MAPENLRAQGLRTRNIIIDEARALLLESGNLEFSLRAVALRAGVSISNLQYYFPTRQAVLRAVMAPVIEVYIEDLRQAIGTGASPRQTLDLIVARAIRDIKDSKGTGLWWHFFSLAAVDDECARMLDEWYDTLIREMAQVLRGVRPDLKSQDSLQAAAMLASLFDGLSVQYARRRRDYMRGLDERVAAAVEAILAMAPTPGKA